MSPAFETTPFQVHFSDEQLADLKAKVKASDLPKSTFEGSGKSPENLGVRSEWMKKAKKYWEDEYDWRVHERRINKLAHFTANVPQEGGEPLKVHFIHEKSSNPSARTVLLLHGWPGDFLEFLGVTEKLKGEFNVVAPSMPGYGFSDPPPLNRDFGIVEVADTMSGLMAVLGYSQYIIQAGDWARLVARQMGLRQPKPVVAIHYNLLVGIAAPPSSIFHHYIPYLQRTPLLSSIATALHNILGLVLPMPDLKTFSLNAAEIEGVSRGEDFLTRGLGYQGMHTTRTSTIAHCISSSPTALLSWNGEKFLDWTDEDPSLDTILTHMTLWHLTGTFASSIYSYRHEPPLLWPNDYCPTPAGYSYFSKDMYPVPRAWVARTHNLKWYKYHAKGGHFAAMEKPQEMSDDIREFVATVWPDLKK